MERGRWVWGLGAAVFFAAVPAHADRTNEEERARLADLLSEGASASRAKSWASCINAFERALAIQEDPIAFGELGLCEEAAGRYADAHKHLRRARAGLTPASDRWKAYQAAFGRATEHVAIVFLTVQPSSARVLIDGQPLGPGDGLGVALAPGRHTISAHLAGYESASETRDMNALDMPNVDLVLKPKPRDEPSAAKDTEIGGSVTAQPTVPSGTPPIATRAPSAAPSAGAPDRGATPAAWYAPDWSARGVFVGLTAAGATTLVVSGATTVGLEIERASFHSQVLPSASSPFSECHGSRPAQASVCRQLVERFERRNTARTVVIGAAVSTAVTGTIAALLIGLDSDPSRPSITPVVSTTAGGIVVEGAW